jgi:AAA+ ATPase superfamily predicted ATPase
LDGLLRELTRSNERYAFRFRPVAADWRLVVAAKSQALTEEVELRQEIDSPYIIGVPLTEQQEIFIGRSNISAHIERLLLDRRQPALLLYGQRRVGKTSLLNNLGRLLPSTIIPLFVDLQGPASRARDHAGFLYNIARALVRSARIQRDLSITPLTRDKLSVDPFTQFEEWLDTVESVLQDKLALLMFDEFEVLDKVLEEGRFEIEPVLGMLRHLIQHRPRFKVLLSGSHTLEEFQRWSGYLINVQVVHIGYLSEEESRQLIEWPVKEYALKYEADASRRVLDLTRGHPFLVQLLCSEIVALKNEQPPSTRRLAAKNDVEDAVPLALKHGSFFFADIGRNQVDEIGLALLECIARRESVGAGADRQALLQCLPDPTPGTLDRALAALRQRELVEQSNGCYRFQVELVRRWFGDESPALM